MTQGTRAHLRGWPLILPLLLLLGAALACNLTREGDDKGKKQETPTTSVSEATQPSVIIQAPDDGAQVLLGTDVLIYAIASDIIGVTRVELIQNGTVVASQASPNLETGDTEFQVLIRWRPTAVGEQTLEIVPWRGNVRGTPATLTLVVRDAASLITPTPGVTAILPLPTSTPEDRTCRVQVAVGALNVRSGPGLVYNVIDSATIGQELFVTGRQLYPAAWWQVFYRGRTGWVSDYYVNVLGDCSRIGIVLPPPTPVPPANLLPPTLPPTNTPLPPSPTPFIPTSTPLPPGTPTPTPTLQPCTVRIIQNGVPIYTGPGPAYALMTILSVNQQFAVVGPKLASRNPVGPVRSWASALFHQRQHSRRAVRHRPLQPHRRRRLTRQPPPAQRHQRQPSPPRRRPHLRSRHLAHRPARCRHRPRLP